MLKDSRNFKILIIAQLLLCSRLWIVRFGDMGRGSAEALKHGFNLKNHCKR